MDNYKTSDKKVKKRISIFQLLIFLVILSAVIVFYINNIIAVNQLISKNSELKDVINKVVQANYSSQIEIERLSSYDRIKVLASEKFGLRLSDTVARSNEYIIINKSEFK
jgi:cell division protein FtsL